MTTRTSPVPATVYLVGAGPGDPKLITVRAVECLRQADVVLYDYLVNPAVVEHAPASAELVPLGEHGSGRSLPQREINARMIDEARNGKTVVRVKGGDPSVFGRGADETGALHAAGIPFEIVPGITTGLAVAAYCEIPITHHEDASAVALIAGRERSEKTVSGLDYDALARFPGTLVFYMGVAKAEEWSRALIERNKPADTPVAIVRRCTWPEQDVIRCTLGTVVETVARRGVTPPAVFVVGSVVDRAPALSWFTSRPLFGKKVLVTGSHGTSEKLRDRLSTLGAAVIFQPAIRITEPPDWTPVDAAIDRLDEYDWLTFSSANGVDYLLRRVFLGGGDARRLGGVRLAAMGTGTADRLASYGLRADVIPSEFVAEALAEALLGEAKDRRFLLARASRGRSVLAEVLRGAGGVVDEIVVYASVDVEAADPSVSAALAAGEIDWITVTSSATAGSLARLYGGSLGRARLASIGPMASAGLRALGLEPAVEASPHSIDGLVDAMLAFEAEETR